MEPQFTIGETVYYNGCDCRGIITSIELTFSDVYFYHVRWDKNTIVKCTPN